MLVIQSVVWLGKTELSWACDVLKATAGNILVIYPHSQALIILLFTRLFIETLQVLSSPSRDQKVSLESGGLAVLIQ